MSEREVTGQLGIPLRVGLGAVFVLAFLFVVFGGWMWHSSMEESHRGLARDLAMAHGQRMGLRVQEAMGAAYMLASLLPQENWEIANFDAIGAELLYLFPMVSSVQLAPKGVVSQIYPLRGNEAAIGHDLLKDKDRSQEAFRALSRQKLILAGPFNLIQGGTGLAGRFPVFRNDGGRKQEFWGFTIALIRIEGLLAVAGFSEFSRLGYRYTLCREMEGGECRLFAPIQGNRLEKPVTIPIEVPSGRWQLSVAPVNGWDPPWYGWPLLALAVLVATLAASASYLLVSRLRRI